MTRKILIIFTVVLALLICSCSDEQIVKEGAEQVYVERVVDGDTFVARFKNGESERVRLIGVDTPETVHPKKPVEHFGREASDYTKRHLEGKIIGLTYDQNKRDRYGRVLAYVWIGETLYNNQIIREGYAFAFTKYPFNDEYMKMFRESERYARENDIGLWAERDEADDEKLEPEKEKKTPTTGTRKKKTVKPGSKKR
jgi:micrococcal nuclease